MNYFILGAVPPPLGGVSVYVSRRLKTLRNNSSYRVWHFDSRFKINLIRMIFLSFIFLLLRRRFEIEVNVSNKLVIDILFFLGLSSNCIFIDHNGYRRLTSKVGGEKSLLRFVNTCKCIKPVNIDIFNYYKAKGVDINKIEVISPYLIPTDEEVKSSKILFPLHLRFLFETSDRNIILASAWKTVSNKPEYDLYGLLDVLDIYTDLAGDFQYFYFVIMLGEVTDDEYGQLIKDKIDEVIKIHTNIIVIYDGLSQLALLGNTKALVRLTKTDGDSVSIREALDSGASVLTTNVCSRPDGCTIFDVGDIKNVREELKRILNL